MYASSVRIHLSKEPREPTTVRFLFVVVVVSLSLSLSSPLFFLFFLLFSFPLVHRDTVERAARYPCSRRGKRRSRENSAHRIVNGFGGSCAAWTRVRENGAESTAFSEFGARSELGLFKWFDSPLRNAGLRLFEVRSRIRLEVRRNEARSPMRRCCLR